MYGIVTAMDTFGTWLNDELKYRGWSMSELARRCDVSHATVSRVISGERKPGPKLCKGIARAFGTTTIDVMRRAGILNSLTEEDLTYRQILDVVKQMTVEERREVLEYALYRFRRKQGEEETDGETELLALPRGVSVHGDLRFEGEGALWGWSLFIGTAEANRKAGGDRLVALPPDDAIQVLPKLAQPRQWLHPQPMGHDTQPGPRWRVRWQSPAH